MKTFFPVLAMMTTVSTSAFAMPPCAGSIKEWQPREALRQMLEADGWHVRTIKAKNGCYQAHAVDAAGAEVEAYFDPKSFRAVEAPN